MAVVSGPVSCSRAQSSSPRRFLATQVEGTDIDVINTELFSSIEEETDQYGKVINKGGRKLDRLSLSLVHLPDADADGSRSWARREQSPNTSTSRHRNILIILADQRSVVLPEELGVPAQSSPPPPSP